MSRIIYTADCSISFDDLHRQMSGVLMVTLLSLLSIGFAALVSIIYRWEKEVSKPRNNAWSFLGTWMGRVSYNIYLFHLVFLLVLERELLSKLVFSQLNQAAT